MVTILGFGLGRADRVGRHRRWLLAESRQKTGADGGGSATTLEVELTILNAFQIVVDVRSRQLLHQN